MDAQSRLSPGNGCSGGMADLPPTQPSTGAGLARRLGLILQPMEHRGCPWPCDELERDNDLGQGTRGSSYDTKGGGSDPSLMRDTQTGRMNERWQNDDSDGRSGSTEERKCGNI